MENTKNSPSFPSFIPLFSSYPKNMDKLIKKTLYQSDNKLTNTFYFAVHLFSNWSEITSKCSKNKNVAHELLGARVTDPRTFWRLLWSITKQKTIKKHC